MSIKHFWTYLSPKGTCSVSARAVFVISNTSQGKRLQTEDLRETSAEVPGIVNFNTSPPHLQIQPPTT